MEYMSLYRKIKSALNILRQAKEVTLEKIDQIDFLPCDYKKSNCLPSDADFVPYDFTGTWGDGYDTHAWFHFYTKAYSDLKDIPLILKIYTEHQSGWNVDNPQFLVYVDGEMRQGLDINHTKILLESQKEHEIHIYAYTGAKAHKANFFAELRRPYPLVQKLLYDIKVPFDSLAYLDENSYEYTKILHALDRCVSCLKLLSIPSEEFYRSIDQASKYMDEIFYGQICNQNSTDGPLTVAIGHTHIDCAWLWTLKQTREKVQRSFSTVVELMKLYPEYRFMSSQALLYSYLKEEAPEMYEQIKQLIREGRWECEGSMWVEADCNLSSGESLVRQILYGKRFFKQEFGIETHILWLPDVFGYSGAMPQILRKSGIDWFVTSKISWNEKDQMPYDTFAWQGIDGTRINSYFLTAQEKKKNMPPQRFTTYNGNTTPSIVAGTYDRYQQKALNNEVLLTFGFGDGGGGPTAEDLEFSRRLSKGIPGTPKLKLDFAEHFLKRLEKRIDQNPRFPVWQGELYLEFHRGTYTTISKNKKNNRRGEFLYLNTEWLCNMVQVLLNCSFPQETLKEGWEMLLTNQFHDILPGSSIGAVYDQCDLDYQKIFDIANKEYIRAKQNIAQNISKEEGYIIFNPNSWIGNGTVRWNDRCAYVENIPPKGYACVKNLKTSNSIILNERRLENDFYRLIFNDDMLLSSIYDKRNKRELLQHHALGNELRVYADYPDGDDAWEWKEFSIEDYTILTDVQSIHTVQDGARAGIRIVRRHLESSITQTVWLYDDIERIDFDVDVDWHQHHQMLKAAFPVDIHTDYATYEIQFGNVKRPTHKNTSWDAMKFEVCAHKFADLSEGNYGVAILNDCKYGHDIHDGVIQLSLLRSPTFPYENADQGRMVCTYSLCPHKGAVDIPQISAMAYDLNNSMELLPASGTISSIPTSFSMGNVDCDNIVCEAIKDAEENDCLIFRFYENNNSKTEAKLSFGFQITEATLCDLMENAIESLTVLEEKQVLLHFEPFEIHTVKVKFKQ